MTNQQPNQQQTNEGQEGNKQPVCFPSPVTEIELRGSGVFADNGREYEIPEPKSERD